MSGPVLNVNETVDQALPGWMRLLQFQHWRGVAASVSMIVDALIDGLFDGRVAALPGQVRIPGLPGLGGFDSADALPLIGRDRRIVQGWTEPPEDYAERLRAWRGPGKGWTRAGTAFGLLMQVRGVLGPNHPTVRIVSQSDPDGGHWHTIEAGGDLVYNTPGGEGFRVDADTGAVTIENGSAAPWDWDSLSSPYEDGYVDPYRVWIIIYAPTAKPLTADGGTWGDGKKWGALDYAAYGSGPHPSAKTWGTHSTLDHVDMIRGVAIEWKAAGIVLDHIIIAFDAASFDPLTASPYVGLPDGYWGNDGRYVGGVKVRSRLTTARYWKGSTRILLA